MQRLDSSGGSAPRLIGHDPELRDLALDDLLDALGRRRGHVDDASRQVEEAAELGRRHVARKVELRQRALDGRGELGRMRRREGDLMRGRGCAARSARSNCCDARLGDACRRGQADGRVRIDDVL